MFKESFLPGATSLEERQPLLLTPSNRRTIEEGRPSAKPQRQNWKTSHCIVLWLLGAVALTVCIKSFIGADITALDLEKALKVALDAGLSGAAATFLSVLTLMPLRTIMNYQYCYGTTTSETIRTLSADGGWTRYYQGILPALIQGPVARFGDTAANAGILALFQFMIYLKNLPAFVTTIFASIAAAAFRMIITPVDTIKTIMQTQGNKGLSILQHRIEQYGIGTLWSGALATALAGFVGHYPWFGTWNYLQASLPEGDNLIEVLIRHAFIGFVASAVSDTVSNSLRVVKTYCQVDDIQIGYYEAARAIIAADGVKGVLCRGLKTRILTNGVQGILFSVLFKIFQDMFWSNTTSGH